jgi:hypothetical protein
MSATLLVAGLCLGAAFERAPAPLNVDVSAGYAARLNAGTAHGWNATLGADYRWQWGLAPRLSLGLTGVSESNRFAGARRTVDSRLVTVAAGARWYVPQMPRPALWVEALAGMAQVSTAVAGDTDSGWHPMVNLGLGAQLVTFGAAWVGATAGGAYAATQDPYVAGDSSQWLVFAALAAGWTGL